MRNATQASISPRRASSRCPLCAPTPPPPLPVVRLPSRGTSSGSRHHGVAVARRRSRQRRVVSGSGVRCRPRQRSPERTPASPEGPPSHLRQQHAGFLRPSCVLLYGPHPLVQRRMPRRSPDCFAEAALLVRSMHHLDSTAALRALATHQRCPAAPGSCARRCDGTDVDWFATPAAMIVPSLGAALTRLARSSWGST